MNQARRFGIPRGPRCGNKQRRALLESNKRMRDGTVPALRSLDFGRVELRIPELDYYILLERFPDLRSHDSEIRTRAWKKFAASELARIYRVNSWAAFSK